MLRKLFISLLILSALTSEGIIKLPANIFNYYLNSDSFLDLSKAEVVLPMLQEDNCETGAQAFRATVSGLFVLSFDSLFKFTPKVISDGFYYGDRLLLTSSEGIIPIICLVTFNSDITLDRTDSSPPINIL